MFTPYFVIGIGAYGKSILVEKTSGRRSIFRKEANSPGYNRNLDKLYVLKDFRLKSLEEQADDSSLPAAGIDDDSIMDELNLIRSLSHPFIARLRGDFKVNRPTRHYFVYDYYVGGSLRSMLSNVRDGVLNSGSSDGRLPKTQACAYFAQCILAMFYLHSNNVYIKSFDPENILIDRHGHLKLSHFGYRYDLNSSGERLNILYLAPELLISKDWSNSKKIHRQRDMQSEVEADYWSLGVLVYELFNGKYPFTADGSLLSCTDIQEVSRVRLRILQASYLEPTNIMAGALAYIKSLLVQNPRNVAKFSKITMAITQRLTLSSCNRKEKCGVLLALCTIFNHL